MSDDVELRPKTPKEQAEFDAAVGEHKAFIAKHGFLEWGSSNGRKIRWTIGAIEGDRCPCGRWVPVGVTKCFRCRLPA